MPSKIQKSTARQTLAINMRAKRKALRISQEELADRAGLHRTYIGAIERGEQNVSVDNIERIARALGCAVVDLFTQVEP